MKRLLFVALALSACHSSTDIAPGCDELKGTCKDAWKVTLRTTTPGAYAVVVKLADGTTSTLSCLLPGAACSGGDTNASATVDTSGIELIAQRSSASFAVTVSRDGKPVFAQTFTPSYAPYYPNGSDCPPMCAGASDVADVP